MRTGNREFSLCLWTRDPLVQRLNALEHVLVLNVVEGETLMLMPTPLCSPVLLTRNLPLFPPPDSQLLPSPWANYLEQRLPVDSS